MAGIFDAPIHFNDQDVRRRRKSASSSSSSFSSLSRSPPLTTGVTIITKQGSELLDAASSKIEIMQSEGLKRWSKISARDFSKSEVIATGQRIHGEPPFPLREDLNDKVALWAGDITSLDCQAIVNSTNETFSERTPLSARIYSQAGPQLKAFIKEHLKVCRTGEAKISKGFNLPARYVIHAVGPKYNDKYQTAAEGALFSAYLKVLTLARENDIRTLGLPPINSVRRGYPPHEGAHMALRVVRKFLEKYHKDFDLIVFAVEDLDLGIYDHLMPLYFPRSEHEQEYACFYLPLEVGGEDGQPVIPERQIRIADKPFVNRSVSSCSEVNEGFPKSLPEEDLEDTVDLSSGLESSIAVGKTVFAQMQPDVDRRWTSTLPRGASSRASTRSFAGFHRDSPEKRSTGISQRRTSSSGMFVSSSKKDKDDPVAKEIKRRNRYDRILRSAKKQEADSFKDLDRLRFLFHAGDDCHGRPVIVVVGSRLPFDGSVDLDRLFSYIILTLDHIVNHRPFIVVYFHAMTTSLNHPPVAFMKYLYSTLDPRSFKNLEALYVIHATLWTRLVFWWFSTFVSETSPTFSSSSSSSSAGIKDKLCFLGGVKFLSHLIPIEQLQIPSVIMNHDFKA